MVCADHVHDIILQTADQCIPVLFGAQGRVHFIVGIIGVHIVRGQCKMVRADLTCHFNPLFFCKFYHADALLGGAVAQMELCPCLFCQNDISCRNDVLHRIADSRQSHLSGMLVLIDAAFTHNIPVLTVGKHRDIVFRCDPHGILI